MRKQDGNDWKFVRKNDYQRLETVVEESSKISSADSTDSTNMKRSYLVLTHLIKKFSLESFKKPKTYYEKDMLRKTNKVRTLLKRMSSHFVK
ncbi:hypothetical protein Phum_PHUM052900 [Pediculus humanus corporis]|uniref:Uncharacterized protein n=1 Tax=Pediculus humanus subsp. corporis TaxID=121224 RepID=E0VB67_PEDHC|nr:uncharacterized protein Phum_PHUM052900 [Pediculus humanus corporis]EEB10623.1 hypothetical protein Phum_PHUM052900 [Pediculus humanus corporis]